MEGWRNPVGLQGSGKESPCFALSLDIGGSHITAAAVDVGTGRIVESGKTKLNFDPHAPAREILDAWKQAVSNAKSSIPRYAGFSGIGVAMPGPFDYDLGICLMKEIGKLESLYGMNIRTFFKNILELSDKEPVIFKNDAVCFLLGEAWMGAAKGYKDAIGITLGTGFGSAFMKKGNLVEHDPGMPPGGWFYNVPFRDGIADDYFSTRGILRIQLEIAGEEVSGALELAQRATQDSDARKVFEIFGSNLAEFLLPFLGSFKPGCVVIGGNIARAWQWFGQNLLKGLAGSPVPVDIKPSFLFDDAALLGAALLPLRFREPGDLSSQEG
jgi:glucokinase